MPTLTCEPRDAGAVDVQDVTELFDEIAISFHGANACIQTCTSGFTLVCDTATSHTCTWGQTVVCDS